MSQEYNSTYRKIKTGCVLGCLGMLVIVTVLIGGGGFFVVNKIMGLEDEFIDMGMVKKEREGFKGVLSYDDKIWEASYFKAQLVQLSGGAYQPIGLLCQAAELDGEYTEKVYFRGQILKIMPGARLNKGLDAHAMFIIQLGQVDGHISRFCFQITHEPNEEIEELLEQLKETMPQ